MAPVRSTVLMLLLGVVGGSELRRRNLHLAHRFVDHHEILVEVLALVKVRPYRQHHAVTGLDSDTPQLA